MVTKAKWPAEVHGSPGSRRLVSLNLGEMPNGAPYQLPVMALWGGSEGPTLFLNAAMHGDEILGAKVVREIFRSFDPSGLRGNIVALPMANFAAVATRTRRNHVEMYPGPHDMNRVFPGVPDGVITERIAAFIMEEFVARADYVFDLHSASVGGKWKPYALAPPVEVCQSESVRLRSQELARAFGSELVLETFNFPGSLASAAASAGVPAGLAEFGVANSISRTELDLGVRGVTNLMKHLEMIDGSPDLPASPFVPKALHRLRVSRGGLLSLKVEIWDEIRRGAMVAEVEALDGAVLEAVVSPVDGRICRINTMGLVGTGDIAVYVGST